jgi:hypothetical protein
MKTLFFIAGLIVAAPSFARIYVFDFALTARVDPEVKLIVNDIECNMEARANHLPDDKLIFKERVHYCFMDLDTGTYKYKIKVKSNTMLTTLNMWRIGLMTYPKWCKGAQRPYCKDIYGNMGYKNLFDTLATEAMVNFRVGNGETWTAEGEFYVP